MPPSRPSWLARLWPWRSEPDLTAPFPDQTAPVPPGRLPPSQLPPSQVPFVDEPLAPDMETEQREQSAAMGEVAHLQLEAIDAAGRGVIDKKLGRQLERMGTQTIAAIEATFAAQMLYGPHAPLEMPYGPRRVMDDQGRVDLNAPEPSEPYAAPASTYWRELVRCYREDVKSATGRPG